MNVLVTGGAGYVGSHAALRLLEAGHHVVIVDALVSGRGHLAVIEAITKAHGARPPFVRVDVNDRDRLIELMRAERIDAVMHFAGLAYVGESVHEPLRYYRANTGGTLALVEAMAECGVGRLIFSSTCATYGEPDMAHIPIREECLQQPINPYGRSKLFAERVIQDAAIMLRAQGRPVGVAMLRYFNVAGCDPAGRLGEDHQPETHLIPICLEAALGLRSHVAIFGEDYPTPDGTCIRDYIHVADLVDAHIQVMEAIQAGESRVYNLGIGRGHSVREVVNACRRITGVDFSVQSAPRRAGDPPILYADASRVTREVGWRPRFTEIDAIVESAWRWRKDHPKGYV